MLRRKGNLNANIILLLGKIVFINPISIIDNGNLSIIVSELFDR